MKWINYILDFFFKKPKPIPPKEPVQKPVQRTVKKEKPLECPSTGKRTLREAKAKEKAKEYKKTSINGYMHPYKCMFCDYWHLSHQKPKR